MKSIITLHATPNAWLTNSVLAPHLDAFIAYLQSGRYATGTTSGYLRGIAHFAYWMTQNNLSVQALDERTVEQFLIDHLSRCDCPRPVMCTYRDLRAALGHLLRVLRQQGVLAELQASSNYITEELHRYDQYMFKTRGLSAGTRRGCLLTVRRLLLYKFPSQAIVFEELEPADVRHFIADRLKLVGTTSQATALASSLRAYFRYRTTCGDSVHHLLGVIASPAHWGLASLPRTLTVDEVNRLLNSFTSSLPFPKRGLAIVHCMLDMGLRCCEVAQLRLSDIDWSAGTVTLRHTKSRRQDILPLPTVTGEALADYVCHERPKTTNPAVFVRCLAPRDKPISAYAIQRLIRDAYRRIGLNHGRSHALRHTLACQLIDHGSSLKEVADVLRHRSLNTTLIYAKLDNRRLIAVALPWPGSTS
jgi:site-specific recombinase XerD